MGNTEDIPKWKVTASRHVLRDRWISVRADDCVTADGVKIAPYYVLEYPDWVHMVALDASGRVLVTRQYRHGAGKVTTELPCGTVDASDATPEAAARRELLEETGCDGVFTAAGSFSPNPANHANTVHVFLVRDTRPVRRAADDPTEVIRYEFMPIRELARLFDSGEFSQSMHVCSVVAALRRAGKLSEFR